jgi:hypothetical protein
MQSEDCSLKYCGDLLGEPYLGAKEGALAGPFLDPSFKYFNADPTLSELSGLFEP